MGTQGCLFAIRRCAEYNRWTPQTIPVETVREAIGETAWQSIGGRVIFVVKSAARRTGTGVSMR